VTGNVWWQETFGDRKRLVAGNVWWQETFGGRKRLVAGNVWWQETICEEKFSKETFCRYSVSLLKIWC